MNETKSSAESFSFKYLIWFYLYKYLIWFYWWNILDDFKLQFFERTPLDMPNTWPFQQNIQILFKGPLDKFNIIPQLFPPKSWDFYTIRSVDMGNDWVLHSRLTNFWRNMNISSIFYFSKSTPRVNFNKYTIQWPIYGTLWGWWCSQSTS